MAEHRISAEDLSAAVRVHADRVHDFVRRLGCSPQAAVEVVETSALDLVDATATDPAAVTDLVGWWFGRARALGRRVSDADSELALGGGVLSADEDQALLAEALDVLPERERVSLLLRDSYDLSAPAVAVALGTDAAGAMATVGRSRLAFLTAVGDDVPSTSGHPVQLDVLARLGEGGPLAAADATARRHAQACQLCRGVWEAQTRAHHMLTGLTVVALPETDRDGVLARVDAQARAYLPAAAALQVDEDDYLEDEAPSRWRGPLFVLLALVAAIVLGTLIGLLLSRSGRASTASATPVASDPGVLPQVTLAPVGSATPSPTASPTASPEPSPTVFVVTPSPSPAVSVRASATTGPEPATEALSLTVDPSSGPNGATVTVQGTGWTPGGLVTLDYLDPLGRQTGSHAEATVDARGRFTTALSAQDPSNLPGRHTIRGSDESHTSSASYTVNG